MEQELSRVRRLRDSCRNEESLRIVTTETVETLWSHVINAKKGDEYAKKLAGESFVFAFRISDAHQARARSAPPTSRLPAYATRYGLC